MKRIFHAFAALAFLLPAAPVHPLAVRVMKITVEDDGRWARFTGQWQGRKKPSLNVELNHAPAVINLHGSYHTRRAALKPSFRLNLTGKNGTLRTRVLKAGYFDPSGIREWLGLKMFATAGIISPEAEFVKLTVNGRSLGVYLSISPVDGEYVRNLYGETPSEGTLLYYGDPPSESWAVQPDFHPLDSNELYRKVYTPVMTGADPHSEELHKLMIMLAPPFNIVNLLSHADLGEWSRWFAVSGIMENRDSPWYRRGNNYTLYRPQGGRWQILPWDLDHIFEGKGLYFPVTKVKGLQALSASALFRQKIRFETWLLVNGSLSSEKVLGWIKEAAELLAQAIYAGEEGEPARQKWEKAVKALQRSVLKRYSRIKAICLRKKCSAERQLKRFATDEAGLPVMW